MNVALRGQASPWLFIVADGLIVVYICNRGSMSLIVFYVFDCGFMSLIVVYVVNRRLSLTVVCVYLTNYLNSS